MDIVDPRCLLRRFHWLYIEVNNDGLLIITHHDAGQRFVSARINLLMGNKRRYIDEVSRPSFGYVFEALSPPHPRMTTDYVDHALQFSVVMRTSFGVRVDRDGARSQLACACRGLRDGCRTCHTRCLGCIKI